MMWDSLPRDPAPPGSLSAAVLLPLGLPQLLTALIYPQLLTALRAAVAITEGWTHSGNFLIAFLLWSQLAEILLQIMGVVVRFGKEVCVVLQKFAANKMIIGKLREKDDYRSD